MSLPNPSMTFTPFDPLPAASMNDIVENVEALAAGTGLNDASVSLTKLTNPYKFSVYRSAAWTTPNATAAKVAFDTKTFDTGTNFDVVTNNRFVAPVTGYYYFSANVNCSTNTVNGYASLYKNGSEAKRGAQVVATNNTVVGVAGLLSLSATDYVEIYVFTSTNVAGNAGATVTYFDGFLLSNT